MPRPPTLDAFLLNTAPTTAALAARMLLRTCRVVVVEGQEHQAEALSRSGGAAIYATWHQRMSYFARYFRGHEIAILVSGSRDGEFAARIASRLGFDTVRGSSTRGGTRALRETIRRVRAGGRIGFLADGPQGPARVAKLGPLFVARDTHAPVLPVVWGVDRAWVFNSWDRFLVPKPLARIALRFAAPIWIPRRTEMDGLEAFRVILEQRLNQATGWCDARFGPERPWRRAYRI